MIKAVINTGGPRKVLLLGFSFGNLDKFRADAPDGYVHIPGTETGLPVDVLVIAGETEAAIQRHMQEVFGPLPGANGRSRWAIEGKLT